jgi:DNA-binding NarL/FixJ family response regulator
LDPPDGASQVQTRQRSAVESETTLDYGVVLQLLAQASPEPVGRFPREVAEELYLSTKAIEHHLGNVFAEVDIRSHHEPAGRLGAEVSSPS